ncbi:hypothetical protein VST7929_01571 [Vibrio stylophorae]|uniref:Uncharacterized protein n=1 Tax=Vibrio stylophorae TaxID=659351 RepID=A0ABM8ZTQ6_9VIBR|nr:DUF6882 domain-containing protein [Vibrio stylophorae]CAH0533696.1 hypothetical protein VST7929_01571 [Vibrio stylophorae]
MLEGIFDKEKQDNCELSAKLGGFLEKASDEFREKQKSFLTKFNPQNVAWNLVSAEGILQLHDLITDELVLEAKAHVVGSLFKPDNIWEWAWNDAQLPELISKESLKIKNFGQMSNIDYLTSGVISVAADQTLASYLAAIGLKICNGEGLYQGEVGDMVYFIVVNDVKKLK